MKKLISIILFLVICNSSAQVCTQPSGLNALPSDITVSISWNSILGVDGYEIEIMPTGTLPSGNGLPISTNNYTYCCLVPNTTYDFYVRANCAVGVYSAWAGPYIFTTINNLIPLLSTCTTILGENAGVSSQGEFNTYIGCDVGVGVYGYNNSFFGKNAGKSSFGHDNNFFGFNAGNASIGSSNDFFGNLSGFNSSGTGNISFGGLSGYYSKGINNSYLGVGSGSRGFGDYNTFVGAGSGSYSKGSNNTYVGNLVGQSVIGNDNLFFTNSYCHVNINGFPYFDSKLVIDKSCSNMNNYHNSFLFGDFATRTLDFNVDVDNNSFVKINAPIGSNRSGLRFGQLNADSEPEESNGKVLSLDANGEVILVKDDSSGGGSTTNSLTNNGNNTLTSDVNSVQSTAPIITQFEQSVSSNTLSTTINGQTVSTPLPTTVPAATTITVSNGLRDADTAANINVRLGGLLQQNTIIDGGSFNYRLGMTKTNLCIGCDFLANAPNTIFTSPINMHNINNRLEVLGGVVIGSKSYTFDNAAWTPTAPVNGLMVEGNIRVGTVDTVRSGNKFEVNGGTVIGGSWTNVGSTVTAPANGLLVQGNVGIGTNTSTATGSTLNTRLVVDSGIANDSGVQLRNLSNSTNNNFLTVDNNGKVILQTLPTLSSATSSHDVYTFAANDTPTHIKVSDTNSSEVLDPSENLTTKLIAALNAGYKKIYLQEGTYTVGSTIVISNKNDVTIEGAGKGTKLVANTDVVFSMGGAGITDFSERNVIKDMTIDLGATRKTAVRILGKAQRNVFDNLFISATTGNNIVKPISIELVAGQEADYNTFSNIYTWNCQNAITLGVAGPGTVGVPTTYGAFNHNTFTNFHIEGFKESAIDFVNANGQVQSNLFSAFEIQAYKTTPYVSRFIVKNIKGANNTFQNFVVSDYSPNSDPLTGGGNPPVDTPAIGSAYAFWVGQNAERTVIENCITEGAAKIASDKNAGWYFDAGRATQFINNANTNRKTDYIKNELDEVAYRGNTSSTSFSSAFSVNKFNDISLGDNNLLGQTSSTFNQTALTASGVTKVSNTWLKGKISIRPQNSISGITAAGDEVIPDDYILTSTLGDGTVKWVNPNSVDSPFTSIYNGDGWLQNDRTVYMQNGGVNNSLCFNKSGGEANDIFYLNSNNNSVCIGANGLINTTSFGANYKLLVNGKAKIRTEVLVEDAGWADYVFAKNYDLKPLTEVEVYIKKYGRLPNMPSAKEIETNGLPLAAMTTRQQEKIEELTLYAIEQEKKVAAQQTELVTLKTELERQKLESEKQKQEMEQLKSLVNQLIEKKK